MPVLKIEYETAQGDRVVEDLTGSAIYELCISMYKLRGTSSINGSRYTRFSALTRKQSSSALSGGCMGNAGCQSISATAEIISSWIQLKHLQ